MKCILKGYDPDLGRKVAEESIGLIIGSRKYMSQAPVDESEEDIDKPMPGESAQEMHDRLMMERDR